MPRRAATERAATVTRWSGWVSRASPFVRRTTRGFLRGRSPGSRILAPPTLPGPSGPVVPSGSLPGHSGATAPDSHRLPSSRGRDPPAPPPTGPDRARSPRGHEALRLWRDRNPVGRPDRVGDPDLRSGARTGPRAMLADGYRRSAKAPGLLSWSRSSPRDVVARRGFPHPWSRRLELTITQSPSPNFHEVTAGPVTARAPRGLDAEAGRPDRRPRQGIVAAPRPGAWRAAGHPPRGYAAMWIDGTRVGVPSDYYYLAATGPALDASRTRRSAAPRASASS